MARLDVDLTTSEAVTWGRGGTKGGSVGGPRVTVTEKDEEMTTIAQDVAVRIEWPGAFELRS
jgi:hypothetical protein